MRTNQLQIHKLTILSMMIALDAVSYTHLTLPTTF